MPERSSDSGDVVVAEIEKNEAETIRVALTTFKGKVGCDIRVYAVYRSTGQLGPTKAGLRVRPDLLEPLIEALTKARAAIAEQAS